MKAVIIIIIIFAIIIGLAYLGQAQKAVAIKQARLTMQLNDGKITQEEYNQAIKDVSLIKMLMNPRYLIEID